MTIPDVTLLLPLSQVLGISVQQLLDSSYEEYGVSEEEILSRGCIGSPLPDSTDKAGDVSGILSLHINTNKLAPSSLYLFSHNLEHTRGCLYRGLSAQLLRNRKFAGRPQARLGVSAEWFGIGERTFFCNDTDPYVCHYRENRMWRRNELNAQTVQNPTAWQLSGIGQQGLYLQASGRYIAAVTAKCNVPVRLMILLTDRSGERIYDEKIVKLNADGWQRCEVRLSTPEQDADGCLRLTFTEQASVVFGAVSLLPENHFHGMRPDVIERMKEIGIGLLRWPGGNFAGEYRWQDMFLPVDQRAPLQAYTEDETQPYSHGYDMHEIDTDDFVALCREIGAEPYITVNLAWDPPEQCAAWVEYCNGPADSTYGSLRARRGHPEPYHVRFWSLGNEFDYGHMEGPMQPEQYAAMAKDAALAMRAVSPDLEICSSGQYQDLSRAESWVEKSALPLSSVSQYISLHTYNWIRHDYASPEGIRRTYQEMMSAVSANRDQLLALRAITPENIRISYDEWNLWAAWFRRSNAMEGLFTARMLQTMLHCGNQTNTPILCYFQPVGEGVIDIFPDHAALSADGQAFSLLKVHKGASLCRIEGLNAQEAAASVSGDILSVSVINSDFSGPLSCSLNRCGTVSETRLLAADDLLPGSIFSTSEVCYTETDDVIRLELPRRSVALVRIDLSPEKETDN